MIFIVRSELSAVRSQFLSASQALSTAKEEHNRAKSAAMATANDLLQHMQLMLAGLKKKVGFQVRILTVSVDK